MHNANNGRNNATGSGGFGDQQTTNASINKAGLEREWLQAKDAHEASGSPRTSVISKVLGVLGIRTA